MPTNRPLRVFLCHSSADKPAVRELYQKLRAEPWIDPWLDEEELFPGMDWNLEIEKAIEATDVILVCLSNNSVTKEGYVQREIRIALDYADYKPEGTLFIIPVRLEECTPPKRLARWQYADYFEGQRERGVQRLLVSLERRAESLGLMKKETQPRSESFYDKAIKHKELVEWFDNLEKEANSKSVSNDLNKITLSNGMEFLRVPAGEFTMGSNTGKPDEKPQHLVNIPYDYWMGRFPVTNEQYALFTDEKEIKHPVGDWKIKKSFPVVNVTRTIVMDYCQWLTNLMKGELPLRLLLRIPTEAEWEKSARGVDGREYPWGNQFDSKKCNTKTESANSVGMYSPEGDSPYGCADMSGNVWEWTHSLKKSYPYVVNDGREEKKDTVRYVLRGGSFIDDIDCVRCTFRGGLRASFFDSAIGFRICIAPPLHK
ncbi:MAG: SUMF1/EgtB/PvdO family nonheme iron enzyme [Anaerolineales bacterium]|nr:SUMF1/EgtB/PvdO family nonheme iron enzyme [Anaerolineales bacterium]